MVIFLLAWGILGYAYYNVTAGSENLESEFEVLAQVLLGIVGTILVFWSFAGFFMWILGKMPKIYYKKINSFVFGELSNKLNSTVISCSVICLLMFMTICILFSAFARKDFKEAEAKKAGSCGYFHGERLRRRKNHRRSDGRKGYFRERFSGYLKPYYL